MKKINAILGLCSIGVISYSVTHILNKTLKDYRESIVAQQKQHREQYGDPIVIDGYSESHGIAIRDLNNDGLEDLVITTRNKEDSNKTSIHIFYNLGNGKFTPRKENKD